VLPTCYYLHPVHLAWDAEMFYELRSGAGRLGDFPVPRELSEQAFLSRQRLLNVNNSFHEHYRSKKTMLCVYDFETALHSLSQRVRASSLCPHLDISADELKEYRLTTQHPPRIWRCVPCFASPTMRSIAFPWVHSQSGKICTWMTFWLVATP